MFIPVFLDFIYLSNLILTEFTLLMIHVDFRNLQPPENSIFVKTLSNNRLHGHPEYNAGHNIPVSLLTYLLGPPV